MKAKIQVLKSLLFVSTTVLALASCAKEELPVPDESPVKDFSISIGTPPQNVDDNYIYQQVTDGVPEAATE